MSLKVNLCGHPVRIEGYINADLAASSEICLDLEAELIPLDDGCADVVVCHSAINYFSLQRGQEIIQDVFRILKPGGVARFGALDLEVITRHYLQRNEAFYFEKLASGRDRYPGLTYCEKLNEFFTGHAIGPKHGKFVYDFETLALRFRQAGFEQVLRKDMGDSVLPEVAQIDNRPEQMFFLEAVKPCQAQPAQTFDPELSRSRFAQARELQAQGRPLEAWQQLLAALAADIRNTEAANAALELTRTVGRPSSGVALLKAHLAALAGAEAPELEAAVALQQAACHAQDREPEGAAGIKEQLADPALRGVEREHGFHLAAGLGWLARAQDSRPDGGVPAMYDMLRGRWDLSYPETTGYIIPTFLAQAEATGDAAHRDRALRMGEFLIQATLPGGGLGEPVGLYAPAPRVFNTSQAMLGFIALGRSTGQERYREQALRHGRFILDNLDPDGGFRACTYQGNKSHKVRTAWALLELWQDTGDGRWRQAGLAVAKRLLRNARANGWFANTSLVQANRPWTHLIGYTLGALEEIRRLVPDMEDGEKIDSLLANAADALTQRCLSQRGAGAPLHGLAGTLDWNWNSPDEWTCLTGNAQLAYFLRRLGLRLGNAAWLEGSDRLVAEAKRLQFFTAARGGPNGAPDAGNLYDGNLDGGLPGCFPLGSGYLPWKQPNWGVKFFCDALLLGLGLDVEGKCLG